MSDPKLKCPTCLKSFKEKQWHLVCSVCWSKVPKSDQTELYRLYKTERGSDRHVYMCRAIVKVLTYRILREKKLEILLSEYPEATIFKKRAIEQEYCQTLVGASPGNVVRFALATAPERHYVGVVHDFRFSDGGKTVFMIATLIRQRNRTLSRRSQEFHLCMEPGNMPEVVDDDWPEFVKL